MSSPMRATVLTPELVPLVLEPAGLGSRALAFLIDLGLALAILTAISMPASILLPDMIGLPVVMTASLVVPIAYHVVGDIRWGGRTLGKRLFGLRVVDARGLPLSPRQSLIRNVARALDALPLAYGVGAFAVVLDPLGRRLGDHVAGTLVVGDRTPELPLREVPALRRVNSLDTPRVRRLVRHRLTLEGRRVLVDLCVRADRLDPEARYDLMEEAGRRLRERLDLDEPHLSGESLVRSIVALF